jgi:hypothetical protein
MRGRANNRFLSVDSVLKRKAATIRIWMFRKGAVVRRNRCESFIMPALLILGMLAISGCSSSMSTSKLAIGPITFTDANGTPQTSRTALAAGESTYVEVNLTNDPEELGADWSIYCGSAPPPGTPLPPGQTQDQTCGTFIPVHTMSGPIPSYVTNPSGYLALYTAPAAPPKSGTVTLYATATSDHSHSSTVTLMVDTQSISIAFAPVPPSTIALGASTPIKAVVNNDPANGGVVWTAACESSDCGSFNPTKTASGAATTYTAPTTAPTGGNIQITAASASDPNKSASFNISITESASSNVIHDTTMPASGSQFIKEISPAE